MADWYCSSAAYTAIAQFAASHVYTIGDIIRPLTAQTQGNKMVFRCTTGGTSSTEPTWTSAGGNNATISSGGATFTNVTGQSTYFWSAAAGDLLTLTGQNITNRFAGGDRIFVSSDHSESVTGGVSYGSGTGATLSFSVGQILSVNRAGSTPPVAADLTAGATVTVTSSSMNLESHFPIYHYGISYTYTGSGGATAINFNSGTWKTHYLDTCALYLNTSTTGSRIANGNPCQLVLNNTTVQFGSTSQAIGPANGYPLDLEWRNTANAIQGATIPTTLFINANNGGFLATCRGVDLSALTGTLFGNSSTVAGNVGSKILLDSCKIASGLTRSSTSNVANCHDLVELINCYDGTNILSESYQTPGNIKTETTITLSGGATDNVGVFSHKMVSGSNVDKWVNTLIGFWMDVNLTVTGSSRTATVEIISSGTLNNDEIWLELEYEGTTSSSIASFGTTQPATILTSNAAVTSSSATWNSSPATPQKQKLQVTFTPQTAGRVRGRVHLGKASTTVYYNPAITIT